MFEFFKFSRKTAYETLSAIFVNLTSAWFARILIAPGLTGSSTIPEYARLLIANLPSGIVGFILATAIAEKGKQL